MLIFIIIAAIYYDEFSTKDIYVISLTVYWLPKLYRMMKDKVILQFYNDKILYFINEELKKEIYIKDISKIKQGIIVGTTYKNYKSIFRTMKIGFILIITILLLFGEFDIVLFMLIAFSPPFIIGQLIARKKFMLHSGIGMEIRDDDFLGFMPKEKDYMAIKMYFLFKLKQKLR